MDELTVRVWLSESSTPILHEDCTAYQKGDFYCVYEFISKTVFKYPIAHIWRVSESYPSSLKRTNTEAK